jgi:hypothetical protein
MDFSKDYTPLFLSIVLLCSFYGLFLAFYVNDKARKLNETNKRLIRYNRGNRKEIDKEFDSYRFDLIKRSKKVMIYALAINIIVNILIIIFNAYWTRIGVVGALLFPILWYLIFLFVLLIAIGLKGQRVLQIGNFLKGRVQ